MRCIPTKFQIQRKWSEHIKLHRYFILVLFSASNFRQIESYFSPSKSVGIKNCEFFSFSLNAHRTQRAKWTIMERAILWLNSFTGFYKMSSVAVCATVNCYRHVRTKQKKKKRYRHSRRARRLQCTELNALYLKRNIISLTDGIACNIGNRHPFVSSMLFACSLLIALPFVAIVVVNDRAQFMHFFLFPYGFYGPSSQCNVYDEIVALAFAHMHVRPTNENDDHALKHSLSAAKD